MLEHLVSLTAPYITSTLEYYNSIQEDIVEFSSVIIIPSNTLDTSIFEDDMFGRGMTVFTEEELTFNPTCNVLVPKQSCIR